MAEEASLVTGFPAFQARCVARRLLERGAKVHLLVQGPSSDSARAFLKAAAAEGLPGTGDVLVGDVTNLDLGLSGRELARLAKEVRHVHHAAQARRPNLPEALVRKLNVDGTRQVLEVAADLPRLERFVHYSTVRVSGDRTGVILEDELAEGQGFRDAVERTCFEAERMVRERMATIPISVLRPSIVVGDSRTGEIDRLDGVYLIIRALVELPPDVPVPLPSEGTLPLNLVPGDWVAAAGDALARVPAAAGRTFHVVDPNPLSAGRVFDLLADAAGRPRPAAAIPSMLYRPLMSVPWIGDRLRSRQPFVESFDKLRIYNCMNLLECLQGTGVACPTFPSYAPVLVRWVREMAAKRRQERDRREPADEADEDPFQDDAVRL